MASLCELRDSLSGPPPEYVAKQLHPVPAAPSVSREAFLLQRSKGRVVLDIGASGPMHAAIVKAAAKCYGIDRYDGEGVVGVNLDDYHAQLPLWPDVELVICGEVIEHLSNPGWFLDRLRRAYPCPTIITVPNAFASVGLKSLERGIENVNREHVAYYSYQTLKELVTRHGYAVRECAWYNGRPKFAEGLIFVVE